MDRRLVLSGINLYVNGIFLSRYSRELSFYTFNHTVKVVRAIKQLPAYRNLSEEDSFSLQVAGWFSDIARLEFWIYGNEAKNIILNLIEASGIKGPYLDNIMQMLLPQLSFSSIPGLCEHLLSDANRFHWFKKSFKLWTERLRKDTELMEHRQIAIADWLKQNLSLLSSCPYLTPHTKSQQLNQKKNLQKLIGQVASIDHHKMMFKDHHPHRLHVADADENEKPDKAVETMFRITSSNNQRLTSLGDNKAHILITVNSIILSAIISLLLRKLDNSMFLIYPTFLLLTVSLLSMVFAILATRPNIPDGRTSQEALEEHTANLLFFGNFYKMSLVDYTSGMQKMMDDKKFLYQSLIRDVYGQGIVLGKKYLLLRVAYNIFMFGLIISVIAFFIVFLYHHPAELSPIKHP